MSDCEDIYLNYGNDQRLIALEKEHMVRRTDKKFDENKIYGLALSGGGIRSASFSLGVLQALAKRDHLEKFDYLSTVSGGGYIGSSLTWFLRKKWKYYGADKELIEFGVSPENFPFGTRPNQNIGTPGAGSREKMSILRHLRQNINYLFPGGGIGPAALFTAIVRGFIINVAVYGPVVLFLLMSMAYFATEGFVVDAIRELLGATTKNSNINLGNLTVYTYLAMLIVIVNMAFSLLYGLLCTFGRFVPKVLYMSHRSFLIIVGTLWIVAVIFLVIGLLPLAANELEDLFKEDKILSGVGITVSGVLSGIWSYIRTGENKKSKNIIPTSVIVSASAVLLMFGVLLVAYFSLDLFLGSVNKGASWLPDVDMYYAFVVLPCFVGLFININYITLHGYYRDRLMELFMPTLDKTTIDKPANAAKEANVCLLKDMCDYEKGAVGPYHLINTNIMLPGSKITKFRGRGGDSFVLSPLYCGSNATGWRRTKDFNNDNLTFASAMAISGAAVNPNTGSNGEGATRNRFLSIIMALLNLRLGFWVKNPIKPKNWKIFQPNLWFPALYDGLFSHNLNERSSYVELSDGGHFENLAVYELVRRKVGVIVLCDGAADKDYTFSDFSNLVEKIRLDFGAKVDIDLNPLIPVKGNSHPYALRKLAKEGYVTGVITYNDKTKASLIYMKTTIVSDLPADIYGYKLKHSDYPDETTADQMFNEKQFEAYRELGYQICKRMLSSPSTTIKKSFP